MRTKRIAAIGVGLMAIAGCGFHGVYSLPLPGAAGVGPHTYTVNVQFADVLDLVPYSAVKVNGATMGHVSKISLQNGHALVSCQLPDSVRLPSNATAQVESTSLLGEKYVELEPPTATPAQGTLVNGDTIPLSRTGSDASVEEVLSALSALLNEGGLAQVGTIARELNTALGGRTGVARDVLHRMQVFAAGLNAQRGTIIRAIDGVNALTKKVRSQEGTLIASIDAMPGALKLLAQDRRGLVRMLGSLQHLGDVAVRVENASQRDLIANLRNLQPTIARLAKVGTDIPKTLSILITYPTSDGVQHEYFGDYGNLSLTIDLSGRSLRNLLRGTQVSAAQHSSARARAGSSISSRRREALK
jgi:phospholipid/cholesterol/gamma-HCH transport system substrate-binding protein